MFDSYDRRTLERYVIAINAVAEIRKQYSLQLERANSVEEATEVAAKAQENMSEAVMAVDGMDLNTFLKISEIAQRDQELSTQIAQISNDLKSASSS